MQFEEGYPYITGESINGAYLVVKTNMDGYVYIVSFADDVKGGLSSEYEFMKFYKDDNGEYKKKVWVQGGVETKIVVSSSTKGSGKKYRVYSCLSVNGNSSEFTQVNYNSQYYSYKYDWLVEYLDNDIDRSNYDIYLMAGQNCHYAYDFYVEEGMNFFSHSSGSYSNPENYELILQEYCVDEEIYNILYTIVTFPDGTTFTDTHYLPYILEPR